MDVARVSFVFHFTLASTSFVFGRSQLLLLLLLLMPL